MSVKTASELLDILNPEEACRLHRLTVAPDGTVSVELYPATPAQLDATAPEYGHPGDSDALEPPGDPVPEADQYPILHRISAESFVDLLTLLDLAHRGSLPLAMDDASLWLGVDAGELQAFVSSGRYRLALSLWRRALTPDEQHSLRVAMQNLILMNPKGAITYTVKTVSAAEEPSKEVQECVLTRRRLGAHVHATLAADADVATGN